MDPKKVMTLSPDKKSCLEAKASEEKTDAICAEEGSKQDPKKELVASADKKSCVEKTQTPSLDKKDENSADAEQKKCEEKNAKWLADQSEETGGRPDSRYSWNASKKTCDDKRADKESRSRDDKSDAPSGPDLSGTPKQAPARFTPVNIPTRQMFILPGMP